MTVSEARPATLASGFDFARRQRDPAFRQHLRSIGWKPGQDIVIAHDDEPVADVLSRMSIHQTSSPCLIAIPSETERFGFRLMFAEVRTGRRAWLRKPSHASVAPKASIGMLYDSLRPCGEYVPSEWAKPVMFERVTTAA